MAGDDATRLQLIELRAKDGPVRAIRFASRLTLVTGFGPPERLASWIATTLAGPRPAGVDGVVAVAGRYLTLGDLPPMLLAPQASLVVADTDIDASRRRLVEPRYERVVERRTSVHDQRAREEQARKTAAARFAELERRLAELEPALADAIEQGERAERRAEIARKLRVRLETVDAAVVAARQPHAEALDLAAEWELLQHQWDDIVATGPALPVDVANERLQVARSALEQADRRRANAAEAERASDAPGRGADGGDQPGFSYSRSSTNNASGAIEDDVRQAEAMLALAEEQLRKAEKAAVLPTPADIAQRQLEVRTRGATILGRFPSEDVAGELRDFRPGVAALRAARRALVDALTDKGIDLTDTGETAPEDTARQWLVDYDRTPTIDYPQRVATLTEERDAVETELRSAAAELVAVAARLRDLDRTLSELAVQEARLSQELASPLAALGADQIEEALRDTFDEFLAGVRGPGRLPIVVGGVTSAFDGVNCERAIRQLDRVSREVQVIVVADRPAIEAWVRGLGDGALVWSPDVAARSEAEERAWREAQEQARHDAEQRAVREAEERARREAEEMSRHEAETRARDAISSAAAEPAVLDLSAAEAAERPTNVPTNGSDATAGTSLADTDVAAIAARAARPVGEDLAQRRQRADQIMADATRLATETNAEKVTLHCDVHRSIETSLHCARCGLPYCDECLALLGEPPALHCVDCALELSGARSARGTTTA